MKDYFRFNFSQNIGQSQFLYPIFGTPNKLYQEYALNRELLFASLRNKVFVIFFQKYFQWEEGATNIRPEMAYFWLCIRLSDWNLDRKTQMKGKYGPRTKIIARPCSMRLSEKLTSIICQSKICDWEKDADFFKSPKHSTMLLKVFWLLINFCYTPLQQKIALLILLKQWTKLN